MSGKGWLRKDLEFLELTELFYILIVVVVVTRLAEIYNKKGKFYYMWIILMKNWKKVQSKKKNVPIWMVNDLVILVMKSFEREKMEQEQENRDRMKIDPFFSWVQ